MGLGCAAIVSERDVDDSEFWFDQVDLIVDAMLGTGFTGEVRQPMASLIQRVNDAPTPVVAIDVPSGMNADTGEVTGVAIRADLTVTFVARKRGFDSPAAADHLGRVVVADIGVPPELVHRVLSS